MTDQLFKVPPRLTERQQYVYRLTEQTTVTADQAGAELHKRQRCPYCTPVSVCQFATSNGREVLEALRKKGLLLRDRHHVYRRADRAVSAQTDEPEVTHEVTETYDTFVCCSCGWMSPRCANERGAMVSWRSHHRKTVTGSSQGEDIPF